MVNSIQQFHLSSEVLHRDSMEYFTLNEKNSHSPSPFSFNSVLESSSYHAHIHSFSQFTTGTIISLLVRSRSRVYTFSNNFHLKLHVSWKINLSSLKTFFFHSILIFLNILIFTNCSLTWKITPFMNKSIARCLCEIDSIKARGVENENWSISSMKVGNFLCFLSESRETS